MKLKKTLLALLLVCFAAVGLTGCGNTAMIVNGEEVPQSVMDYYMESGKMYLEAYGIDIESEDAESYLPMLEENAVSSCEQMALIRAEAKKLGLEVTDEEVQTEFESQKEYFESEEAYNEYLKEYGFTEDAILWLVETELYYSLLYDEVNKDITATDEELQAAYNADPSAFDSVNVSYILIQPEDTSSDESWAAAEAEANEVITKLNEGGDFATLAGEYSDDASTASNGGVLGEAFTAKSDSLDEAFVKAAFGLAAVGDYTTAPVKSESFGYFIIKLDAKTTGWENLKDSILESLLGEERDDNFNAYMETAFAEITYDKEYKYKYKTEDAVTEDNATEDGSSDDGTTENGDTANNGTTENGTADDNGANSETTNQ